MTIHDVAARAGVSVATVSRVLNAKGVVREETTRQVLAAAKSLRFVPNVAARSLSIRRSQTVGIVLPDVHGEFFSEVIRGIDIAARAEGYHILVSGSHSNTGEMLEVIETMRGRVDGIVVMQPDSSLASLRAQIPADLPLVLLNSSDGGHDAINIDNFGGAREMMRHLTALGHSRIAFVKGPKNNRDARERLRGYRQEMRKIGVEDLAALELGGDFTESSGYVAAMRMLASGAGATALFAANDSMAVGALSAFAEARVDVPASISVAGFDDIPIARYVSPPLTTVSVDISELGRRSFALLLETIGGPLEHAVKSERIGTTLVVRKSCAAPRTNAKESARPDRKLRGDEKGEYS